MHPFLPAEAFLGEGMCLTIARRVREVMFVCCWFFFFFVRERELLLYGLFYTVTVALVILYCYRWYWLSVGEDIALAFVFVNCVGF